MIWRELKAKYQGKYIRIGRSPRTGPIYITRRYNRNLRNWTMQNLATEKLSWLSLDEFETGLAEGIIHIIGEVGRDALESPVLDEN